MLIANRTLSNAAGAAVVALLAAAPPQGLAQSTVPPPAQGLAVDALHEVDDDEEDEVLLWYGIPVDELDEMEVVNAAGEEIGDVDEVLADVHGAVVAVTVEVGGFLDIGEAEVVFDLDYLTLQGDDLVTSLTTEQIEALPRWDD